MTSRADRRLIEENMQALQEELDVLQFLEPDEIDGSQFLLPDEPDDTAPIPPAEPVALTEDRFLAVQEYLDISLNENYYPRADFTELRYANNEQRQQIEAMLLAFFNWWNQPANVPLVLRCRVYTESGSKWMTIPLNPTNYRAFIDKLRSHSFLLEETEAVEFNGVSDGKDTPLPEWRQIMEFRIEPARGKVSHQRREGGFLPYVLEQRFCATPLVKCLARMQVFPSIKEHTAELKESCWVYALQQAGIEKEAIQRLKLQLSTIRNADATKLQELTEAVLGKTVVISYLEETDSRTQLRTIGKRDTQMCATEDGGLQFSNILRTRKWDADIVINCINKHYFLEFRSGITSSWQIGRAHV